MKTKDELIKKRNELQEQIDNFKEETKLEKGKWYKTTAGFCDYIVNYSGNDSAYGFFNGGYMGLIAFTKSDKEDVNLRLATDQEVESALIKEAKKRGFKEGVEYNFNGMDIIAKGEIKCGWYGTKDSLYFKDSDRFIFRNGVWAEIIEDKKPTINGYEMEYSNNGYIKFGCKSFPTTLVFSYYELSKKLHIDSFKIDDELITVKQLKEVVDYLNK